MESKALALGNQVKAEALNSKIHQNNWHRFKFILIITEKMGVRVKLIIYRNHQKDYQ
jgi:hypothetical protein